MNRESRDHDDEVVDRQVNDTSVSCGQREALGKGGDHAHLRISVEHGPKL